MHIPLLTRVLLGTLALGAVLVPTAAADAQPVGPDMFPGVGALQADDELVPNPDPCGPDGCLPPEPEPEPEPECPPFVFTCEDMSGSQCDPIEEDCSPGPECPADADCPAPECPQDAQCPPPPEPEPEPEVDPDPEPVDPSLPADPNFTG
jgi:hypothetical protein